jgi:hypothetical protein
MWGDERVATRTHTRGSNALTSVPDAIRSIETELPPGFPAQVWESVTGGLDKAATAFLDGIGRDAA